MKILQIICYFIVLLCAYMILDIEFFHNYDYKKPIEYKQTAMIIIMLGVAFLWASSYFVEKEK